MARRVRVIWVLISGLSLLLLALFVTKQESEQVETEKQSGNKLRNELPAPAVDGREASPTAPLRLPLRGRHVQVCSETGQPLANAVIHGTESDSRRWYPIEDLSFIGKTDSAGLLALNDATPPYLIASLAGFVPTGTKVLDDPDAVTTIVLQASCRASYLCTTRDGRPVPGVAIQVSLSPLDRRERLRHNSQLLPGGNPATAVYWVTTDASGQAQMSDVPVGVCHIAVGHTDLHYALVGGLPAGDFRLGPGINSFHFKFDPVWASWVEVVGDKLEDWRASYPEALWVPPLAVVDLGLRSQAMRGTGANIVAMLCCPTYSESAGYSEPPRETEVRLLLSERGWLVRKVPMRPIAEWRAPEQLLLGGASRARQWGVSWSTSCDLMDP